MLSPRDALFVLNLIPGIGSIRIQSLLNYFSSAELVLSAPEHILTQVPNIGKKVAATLVQWQSCTNYEEELAAAERLGVRIVSILDDEYPPALRLMSDAPIILYVKGASIAAEEPRSVAIVGSRQSTPYGMITARRLSSELADAGCTIISGLARGIDTAAHWGALDVGGRTIGVLGSGQGCFFPEENIALAERMIAQGGSIVSEFPLYMRPSRTSFPQRNRIVAAWSQATLVVEAPNRSGSLHTARLAVSDYGRQAFAVPGNVENPNSLGCHELIRDGAILCASAQHLLSDMNWLEQPDAAPVQAELFAPSETPPSRPALTAHYQPIYDAIAAGNHSLDALCVALGMGAHELTPLLMRMQIEGFVRPMAGAQYCIVE